jgi:hypothetical protein
MYFPRPRLKRRTFLDWPPSGGRGNVHETVVFAIFLLVVGSIPGWSENEKVLFFSFSFNFFANKCQIAIKKTSLIRPKVFKGSGISFVSWLSLYPQIIASPQGGFHHIFSPSRHENTC